ncbi:hypothetical protein [Streptomyces sp. NPDC052496]|uniref:hypothetical protein n=1 Tax=Streptomyces sp. NPDC052496 TaxID=3154951 RepID=UPI003421CCC6
MTERYAWLALCGIEMLYVVPVLLSELVLLALRRPIARFERRLHAVSDDRFFTVFLTPTLAFVGGLAGGLSTGMIGEGRWSTVMGGLLTVYVVYVIARHQYGEATGKRPRPVTHARWWRQAAETARLLSEGPVPAGRERSALRRRAERLGVLGDRIAERVTAETWLGAFRAAPRRRQVTVVLSLVVPVVLMVWPAISHGVTRRSLPGYAGLLVLSAGAVATHGVRRLRTRRTLLALAHGLTEQSHCLLERLARTAPPRQRPLRARPAAFGLRARGGRRARGRAGPRR